MKIKWMFIIILVLLWGSCRCAARNAVRMQVQRSTNRHAVMAVVRALNFAIEVLEAATILEVLACHCRCGGGCIHRNGAACISIIVERSFLTRDVLLEAEVTVTSRRGPQFLWSRLAGIALSIACARHQTQSMSFLKNPYSPTTDRLLHVIIYVWPYTTSKLLIFQELKIQKVSPPLAFCARSDQLLGD